MNKLLTTIIFSCLIVVVTGQTLEVEISSDSILMGNAVKVTYTLENAEGTLPSPDFGDCTIISGPNVSSSISIINGDKSSKITHSYFIRPEKEGVHTIESIFIDQSETQLYSTPLVFEVFPNPDNILEDPFVDQHSQMFQFRSFPFDPPVKKEKEPKEKSKRKLKRI